jgi:peptidoglycan/LPS O-acetylase OafA/YrhL
MPKGFSLYLDLIRFLAAMLVVLSHLAKNSVFPEHLTPYVPDFGREAVIIFFVLSGYVIAYTKEHKHKTIDHYCIARLTRIYSVAFPVLLLTVALDLIGLHYNPDLYTGLYQYEKLYLYIPLHLAFLGEIWTLSEQPFTVAPYWSMGYEVWYYVFFIFFGFYSGVKRWVLCLLTIAFVGYKLLLLLPVWLAGVYLYKYRNAIKLNLITAKMIFFSSVICIVAFEGYNVDSALLKLGESIWPFSTLSLGSAASYLADFATCILVIINFYSAQFLSFKVLHVAKTSIVNMSSYTFTLYLLHAPIMIFLLRNTGIEVASYLGAFIIIFAIFISTLVVGELTEKRKHVFKPIVSKLVDLAANLIRRTPIVSRILTTKTVKS